ncbi:DNA mismatch repair protein mutS [Candidatus Magnetoovum chiemensis]|nr:DNA mismatch repair protein mutS [Candidatus Magnetoovum chiemensis]
MPEDITPVMKQYQEVKEKYSDAIVLFRIGDFYEIFGSDAKIASKILQIALTSRDKNKENPIPLCGFPYHSLNTYVKKLMSAGQKAVVCDQVEDPALAKGIVKREVSKVYTPGTYEPDEPKENSYILSFYPKGLSCGIAVAEVSTGELFIFETHHSLGDEITRINPKEVLCPESLKGSLHYSVILKQYYTAYYGDYYFDYAEAYRFLLGFFKVATLDGFGAEDLHSAVCALGALLAYLLDGQNDLSIFSKLKILNTANYMFLETNVINNLELVANKKTAQDNSTLLNLLDETITAMGGRFLRNALIRPLIDINEINRRLNSVETLFNNYTLTASIGELFKNVSDLERITSRIIRLSASPRDLIALKSSVEIVSALKDLLKTSTDDYLLLAEKQIPQFNSLITLINDALPDTPAASLKNGDVIKNGFNKEIDELRDIAQKGKTFISELEIKERKETGIGSLKISYNKVFGYYIEVTKANLHLVPDYYTRKQTLVNAERFITKSLKDYENKALGAQERLISLETLVFKELLEEIKLYSEDLKTTANVVAQIDFLQSLASAARKNNYIRPQLNDTLEIDIKAGRHPVLEKLVKYGTFIPNDIHLDGEDNKIMIITGPNMAGKSSYMRQTALLVLMAQMGSFVPAESASIGIADRIFTRIGASDYLTLGQSTFMVEMVETANIVNNATAKSLILLDEIGRGTSTYDGISIAWAVCQHIADKIGARTLFATHYNELTELAATLQGVKNLNVSVKEWGDEIIFLHKISAGSADRSYGIHVAQLAGLPHSIIERAKTVLLEFEKDNYNYPVKGRVSVRKKRKETAQLNLFQPAEENAAESILGKVDLENLSRDEAINLLRKIKDYI